MKKINLLFTCCLGEYAKGTIDCLKKDKRLKINIIGTDIEEMSYNFNGIDMFFVVPKCSDKKYLEAIKNICESEKVDVIVPTHTSEQVIFSKNLKWFEMKGIAVIVSKDYKGLEKLNNKYLASAEYKSVNKSYGFTSLSELYEITNKKDDWVIKEKNNCGARGFFKIDFKDEERTKEYLKKKKFENLLVQKYLCGEEYTVDCFCKEGEVLCSVVKLNKKMENGVAKESVIVNDFPVYLVCEHVCEESKYSGPIGFDVKKDERGMPFVIDINPRFTATVSLCEKGGVNIPLISLKDTLGIKYKVPKKIKQGVKVVRRKVDVFFDEKGKVWKK